MQINPICEALESKCTVNAVSQGRITLTANMPYEMTVDVVGNGGFAVLDLTFAAPTQGAQYITLRRTEANKYRIQSTVGQDVTIYALILKNT